MVAHYPDHFNCLGALWNRSMRLYSEALKADVRWRMGPPHRQNVAEISQQLGIHVLILLKCEIGFDARLCSYWAK